MQVTAGFIILDVLMPEMNGLDTLKELMQLDRSLNVIMLSCSNEVGTVVEAIRIGAHDYLTKPFEKGELDAAIAEVAAKEPTNAENQALRDYCDQVTEDLSFLAPARRWSEFASRFCRSRPWMSVSFAGERVGKEVVSRIHLRSKRRKSTFVKVNCAALPANCWNRSYSDSNKERSRRGAVQSPENSNWPIRARFSR